MAILLEIIQKGSKAKVFDVVKNKNFYPALADVTINYDEALNRYAVYFNNQGGAFYQTYAASEIKINTVTIDNEATLDAQLEVLFLSAGGAASTTLVPLIGNAWDGSNASTTLTANRALTLNTTKGAGILLVKGNSSYTLSINGVNVPINNTTPTVIGYTQADGNYYAIDKDGLTVSLQTTPAVEEFVAWGQLSNMADAGNGTLDNSNGSTGGGTATKKLSKVDGNYIQYVINNPPSAATAFVLALDEDNDASYLWSGGGSVNTIASVYYVDNLLYFQNGPTSSSTSTGLNPTQGTIVRMTISGNNVIVSYSINNGVSFTNLNTISNVLVGISNIYIKGILALGTADDRKLLNVKGYGLVTI